MVRDGSRGERDLVKLLWEKDFAAMRAPASGGATKKPLPDIIAGNGEIYLAIEVKMTSGERIYIDSGKIKGLLEFSEMFGAEPYIGVKFRYRDWIFLSPADLEMTPLENYRLDLDIALERGRDIHEITGRERQTRLR
ncbi:Holliday junction resolvase Hjc [Methanothermobacter sp.]|uniref:Holliday junction resolvase Hjc n=1 Tax=Methanothermobacter sp. TaxID=1884223 RepID=UPI002607A18A|nr:Holliday junction resolvase Hjc [Methanothermobacter sp.]MDI9614806.1 Holliday junction resolvase Hjc [Methanothermobacter sp.]